MIRIKVDDGFLFIEDMGNGIDFELTDETGKIRKRYTKLDVEELMELIFRY